VNIGYHLVIEFQYAAAGTSGMHDVIECLPKQFPQPICKVAG
jgi:hypothetical protein